MQHRVGEAITWAVGGAHRGAPMLGVFAEDGSQDRKKTMASVLGRVEWIFACKSCGGISAWNSASALRRVIHIC